MSCWVLPAIHLVQYSASDSGKGRCSYLRDKMCDPGHLVVSCLHTHPALSIVALEGSKDIPLPNPQSTHLYI